MRTIRASEIGTFLFCARAWWYQRNGFQSDNQQRMEQGSVYHQQHSRSTAATRLMRRAGWVLLAAGLLLVAAILLA